MEIKLEVPNELKAIKLKDYQKYFKIALDNEGASAEFLDIKMLEIFCDLKYKDISSLPVGSFNDVVKMMAELFLNKTPLVRRFEMTGSDGVTVEFGLIPNMDKMTMGEYIDLNSYLDEVDDLNKAMAVLYRPIHKDFKNRDNYKVGSYQGTEEFSDIMKDMPLGIALGAKVFFYRLGIKLSRRMMHYSHRLLEEDSSLSEAEKKTLTENMDGIENFIHLQEGLLLNSMKLR